MCVYIMSKTNSNLYAFDNHKGYPVSGRGYGTWALPSTPRPVEVSRRGIVTTGAKRREWMGMRFAGMIIDS